MPRRNPGTPPYKRDSMATIAERVANSTKPGERGTLYQRRPIRTQAQVRDEMVRLYHALRGGKLDTDECGKQVRILSMIAEQIELERDEERAKDPQLNSDASGSGGVPGWVELCITRGKALLAAPRREDQSVVTVDAPAWEERPESSVAVPEVQGGGGES